MGEVKTPHVPNPIQSNPIQSLGRWQCNLQTDPSPQPVKCKATAVTRRKRESCNPTDAAVYSGGSPAVLSLESNQACNQPAAAGLLSTSSGIPKWELICDSLARIAPVACACHVLTDRSLLVLQLHAQLTSWLRHSQSPVRGQLFEPVCRR